MDNSEFTLEDLAAKIATVFTSLNGPFNMEEIKAQVTKDDVDLFLSYLKEGGLKISAAKCAYQEKERTEYWHNSNAKISFVDVLFEKNMALLLLLPKMFCSFKALQQLEQNRNLARLFAFSLVKINKGTLPVELEVAIVNLPSEKLVQDFVDVGYEWSNRAKRRIELIYPEVYERIKYPRRFLGWLAE